MIPQTLQAPRTGKLLAEELFGPVAIDTETRSANLHLRLKPSEKEWLNRELHALGVRDQAAFFRGALIAGVGNAQRSQDRLWKQFLREVEPIAQKYFGAPLKMGDPSEYELQGGTVGSVSLKEARARHRGRR